MGQGDAGGLASLHVSSAVPLGAFLRLAERRALLQLEHQPLDPEARVPPAFPTASLLAVCDASLWCFMELLLCVYETGF